MDNPDLSAVRSHAIRAQALADDLLETGLSNITKIVSLVFAIRREAQEIQKLLEAR